MPRVYVGVGSNVDRDANIRSGVRALRAAFGRLTVSRVYRSRAVGFEGEDFYNLVVGFDTDRGARDVALTLHEIEQRFGRARGAEKFSPRTLDLDLLLYDNLIADERDLELPRADIGRYSFVLRPLAEIAGAGRHPVTGRTFADMWADFDGCGEPLQPVDIEWDDSETLKSAER